MFLYAKSRSGEVYGKQNHGWLKSKFHIPLIDREKGWWYDLVDVTDINDEVSVAVFLYTETLVVRNIVLARVYYCYEKTP